MMQAQQHDCMSFLTYDAEKREIICTKCGTVIEDPELKEQFYTEISELSEDPSYFSRFTAEDHNAGDDMLDSITPQQGYTSINNQGVAMRIKGQLRNPYRTGLIADERGAFVKEDPITQEKHVEFSRYNVNLLNLWKRSGEELCTKYNLDTIEKTHVARQLKRKYSRLLMPGAGTLADFVLKAALLDANILRGKEKEELEKAMYEDLDRVRLLLLSRGETTIKNELLKEEAESKQTSGMLQQPMKAG